MRLEHAALIVVGSALIVAGSIAACQRTAPPNPRGGSPAVPPGPAETHAAQVVVIPLGSPRPATRAAVAIAEVVSTLPARERGLMDRDGLEPDHGMLFVYPAPAPRNFWMKGCRIALDIAFVRADGTIARVATLPPGVGREPGDIPSASSGEPALYVLEMESGWFARHGVAAGARIDVSAAVAGVEAE